MLSEGSREIVSEMLQKPGGFRACSRCGWVRFIAFSWRRAHCTFPGKQHWRCGAHLRQGGWALCEEIPGDRVAARNEAVRQAFRAVQLGQEASSDGVSRCKFLTALRAATSGDSAPAAMAM